MKPLISGILILFLAFVTQFFMPWWHIALAGFIGTAIVFPNHARKSFVSGFIAIALYWGIYAVFLNNANEGILATRISIMLNVRGPLALILGTALFGGLLGGFGAMTGDLGRHLITNDKK